MIKKRISETGNKKTDILTFQHYQEKKTLNVYMDITVNENTYIYNNCTVIIPMRETCTISENVVCTNYLLNKKQGI